MKKLALLPIALLFLSCGHYKTDEIRVNQATYETVYSVCVWKDLEILKSYQIPIETITPTKKDSLNKVVDEYIDKLNSIDQ